MLVELGWIGWSKCLRAKHAVETLLAPLVIAQWSLPTLPNGHCHNTSAPDVVWIPYLAETVVLAKQNTSSVTRFYSNTNNQQWSYIVYMKNQCWWTVRGKKYWTTLVVQWDIVEVAKIGQKAWTTTLIKCRAPLLLDFSLRGLSAENTTELLDWEMSLKDWPMCKRK